ncbi:MAG: class I SAM-dependent methyltransferase [Marinilabiliaceae bacterium]
MEEKQTINKTQQRYNRIAGFYDVLEAPMELFFSKWRKVLLSEAYGETLEIGMGTGKNIPFYPENVTLTGIDFSPKMVEIANGKLRKHPRPHTRIMEMDTENLQFDDNTFDTVVASCVFCSVPDAVKGLKEIKRVTKNDGIVLMLEHVRSNNKTTGKFMDMVNPVSQFILGEDINRRTYDNLIRAGFKPGNIQVENIWLDIVKLIRINQ